MRFPTFDIIKFLAMVMVVRGHIEGNGFLDIMSGIGINISIGVAMPYFFMVSGYFSAHSLEDGDFCKLISRIAGFLWPLAAFGVTFGLVLLLLCKIPLWKFAVYPIARVISGSWFLTTLAILHMLFFCLFKIAKRTKRRLIISFLLYTTLFFWAGQGKIATLLSVSNVLHMFPYFAFGVLVLKPFQPHKKWPIAVLCGIFFLAIAVMEGDVRSNGMGFYWVPTDWQTVVMDRHLFICFWARSLVGISGSVFILWAVDQCLKMVPKLSKLAVFGTTSLGVYVLHEWPLIQIHKYCSFDPLPSFWRWPLAFCLFFLCHFITIGIKSNSKFKFFFFGDEKWLKSVISQIMKKRR